MYSQTYTTLCANSGGSQISLSQYINGGEEPHFKQNKAPVHKHYLNIVKLSERQRQHENPQCITNKRVVPQLQNMSLYI